MAVLEILQEPDPRLLQKSQPVSRVTDTERQILRNMIDTMQAVGGIGLAAPQVNILKRMIVIDVTYLDQFKNLGILQMINPELTDRSVETVLMEEACLSVDNYYCAVERHTEVEVTYLDENGVKKTLKATEKLAHALQHEIDHLDGILFIQRLSKLKYERVLKKLSKRRMLAESASAI